MNEEWQLTLEVVGKPEKYGVRVDKGGQGYTDTELLRRASDLLYKMRGDDLKAKSKAKHFNK